ncbi:hypothetical protein COB52_02370 [Candidatus Kaiserbacteria bacterium]|nr:MAG: hypothetical protein COB52_02370 [Candidatus Kaiserbacteria bacterium]
MSFHLRSKRQPLTLNKKVFVTFLTVTVFLTGLNVFFDGVVSSVVSSGMANIPKLDAGYQTKKSLIKETAVLKERILELELYSLNNIVLDSENRELRRLLNDTNIEVEGVLSRVLSDGGKFPYGTIQISQKADRRHIVGRKVFATQNSLLGEIVESGKYGAMVKLISSPENITNVLVGSEDRLTQVDLRGVGNGNMVIEVARGVDIRLGDPVVAFGVESALVGYVGDIESSPTNAAQLIRVVSPLNISTVRFVYVR